jgi:hypothetical protein
MAIRKATNPETVRQSFERWLEDGQTFIAVFENHDLGHRDRGRRVAFPFDDSKLPAFEVGKTQAPDHGTIGLGWRYLLVFKTKDAQAAVDALAWQGQLRPEAAL